MTGFGAYKKGSVIASAQDLLIFPDQIESDRSINKFGASKDVFKKDLRVGPKSVFKAYVIIFVSQLAMVAGKITAANAALILKGIRNKPKRDCEAFLSRVSPDGTLTPGQETVSITLTLQMALLDRAREVLSHGGHVPKNAEVVISALGDLLEHSDPVRKAERAKIRQEKKSQGKAIEADVAPGRERTQTMVPVTPVPDGVAPQMEPTAKKPRSAIPEAIRHEVWSRDDGRCTWTEVDGSRCNEKMMLELDHVHTMHCHGGTHTVENLALTCRRHNQLRAKERLGEEFWEKKRLVWDQTP